MFHIILKLQSFISIRNQISIPCNFAASLFLTVSMAATAAENKTILGEPEKDELRIGFVKLTDMAPLAIAYENGYFEDEGLFVTLEAQANWKVLLDGVIDGKLDAAHMLAGQALAASIGYGTTADIIAPLSMDLNGNGITVSNAVWAQLKKNIRHDEDNKPVHPISAAGLKPIVEEYQNKGEGFNFGMVFPVSSHNYELRYWLAAGGIHPGFYAPHKGDTSGQINAEVLLSVTPPPQMPSTLEAGTIQGYCVGEPWNQQALYKGIGVPVITDYEIWKNNPEKILGISRAFYKKHPNTSVRIVKAMLRAAKWLDKNSNANRAEAVEILAQSEYVGADKEIIANSMLGTFEYEKGDKRSIPDFNVFFRGDASYPYYSDAIWTLTQMRRWGQIPTPQTNNWYFEVAKKVYRPDIYKQAALALIDDGVMTTAEFPDFSSESGFREASDEFIDQVPFDAKQPNVYLQSFKIGLKSEVL